MLLAIDIGNSNTVIGFFDSITAASVRKHWRITSGERTVDEYGALFLSLLGSAGIAPQLIRGSIICSVVPSLTGPVKEALQNYIGTKPLVVGDDVEVGMPVFVDNPGEVGADRLVNALAAYSILKTALIVVDFGTATTFDYVTGRGEYAGGAIAPGLGAAAGTLFTKTAKLPRFDASKPERVIGRNTAECMRSGVYFGFAGLADGIIERMKKEAGVDTAVVATGGLAGMILGGSRHITSVDEFLTLKGLKLLYEGI